MSLGRFLTARNRRRTTSFVPSRGCRLIFLRSLRRASLEKSQRHRSDSSPKIRFALDSPLEGTGFEPSVPLLRKALLGVANRRRRHERRSHLQVQVRNGNACLEWLPIAFPFAEGPRS